MPIPFAYLPSPKKTVPASKRSLQKAAAAFFALGALCAGAFAAGCAPMDFTFEESNAMSASSSSGAGAGSSGTTTSGAGGMGGGGVGGGAGGSASGSTSSSSGLPETCPPSYSCAPPVPAGWLGYDIILVDADGGPKPQCPLGDMATKLFASPVTAAHTCSACSGCSRSGASCTSPEITCWVGAGDCVNGTPTTYGPALNSACANDSNVPAVEGVPAGCKITGNAMINGQGQCNVNNDAVPQKPGTWNEDVHTCDSITGPVCGANKTCVTSPLANQQICVHKAGTDACPADFPKSVQAYGGANDSRDCTSCGCAAITGCSGGKYTAYDLLGCDAASPVIAVIDSAVCTAANDIFDGSASSLFSEVATPMDPQQCTGGTPTGSLTPTSPMKYCCL